MTHKDHMSGEERYVPSVASAPRERSMASEASREVAPPFIHNGDHAEFEAEWAGRDQKERPDWPLPSFLATDWADAFMKHFGHRKDEIDEGLMLAWFANALMRGYDEAYMHILSSHSIAESPHENTAKMSEAKDATNHNQSGNPANPI